MDQSQQELRRAAANAFMESLNQLGSSLATEGEPDEPPAKPIPTQPQETLTVKPVQALEDAVADIEQFMQSQQAETEI